MKISDVWRCARITVALVLLALAMSGAFFGVTLLESTVSVMTVVLSIACGGIGWWMLPKTGWTYRGFNQAGVIVASVAIVLVFAGGAACVVSSFFWGMPEKPHSFRSLSPLDRVGFTLFYLGFGGLLPVTTLTMAFSRSEDDREA